MTSTAHIRRQTRPSALPAGAPALRPAVLAPTGSATIRRVNIPMIRNWGSPLDYGRLVVGLLANFALACAAGLAAMSLLAGVLGYAPIAVTTGSMEPTIRPGDVVIIDDDSPVDDLFGPTVIEFSVADAELTRLHRIVEALPEGYRTKGDANQTSDAALVPREDVRGIAIALLPYVALPRLWIQRGQWWRLVAAAMVLVLLALAARTSWLDGRSR